MDAHAPDALLAPPCVEEGRLLFHERLSQFFEKTEGARIVVGRCTRCGADGVAVHDEGGGAGPCRAQASLTQKRHAPAEGQPIAYGVPLKDEHKRGYFSLASDGVVALVEPDRSIIVTNVAPTSPLPGWVEAHRLGQGPSLNDLIRRCLEAPRAPFLLAGFGKKGGIPLAVSHSPAQIVLNGTDPVVRLDRGRLARVLALTREFGVARLKAAIALKAQIAAGEGSAVRGEFAKLREKAPDLVARFDDVPGPEEAEKSVALSLVEREEKEDKLARG